MERTTVDCGQADGQVMLRATVRSLLFDGFLRVYEEAGDDSTDEDDEASAQIEQGEVAKKQSVDSETHFTLPPPAITEATLGQAAWKSRIGPPLPHSQASSRRFRIAAIVEKTRTPDSQIKGGLVTAFLFELFSPLR